MTHALGSTAMFPVTSREELEAHWMPFTPNRDIKEHPRMIVRAEGCHITTADGRRVFDSLSGLWCCGLGHGRTEISRAVAQQIQELDYAPAFQFGHPLSFRLANMLKDMAPPGLDYVFFTNSGSEAADTSLKMARAYWRQKGQPTKTKFIGRHPDSAALVIKVGRMAEPGLSRRCLAPDVRKALRRTSPLRRGCG